MSDQLIVEGEGIPYQDAIESFIHAANTLLQMQDEAAPMECAVLKDVEVDAELVAIRDKYKSQ